MAFAFTGAAGVALIFLSYTRNVKAEARLVRSLPKQLKVLSLP